MKGRYSVSTEQLTFSSNKVDFKNGAGEEEPDKKKEEPQDSQEGKWNRRRFVIEPVMMLYYATYSAMFPLTSQYVLYVMMNEYNATQGANSTSSCGEMDKNSTYYIQQQKAQGASAQYTLIYNLTQGIPAMVVALFLGSYTDHHGRKLALILPTIGLILRCLSFILQQLFQLPLWVTIIGVTLDGLSGSNTILLTTCYACISDTVPVEKRSFRIMILEAAMNAFQAVLQLSMGYMIAGLGYLWPYVVLVCVHVVNLVYTVGFVPESRAKDTGKKAVTPYYIIESFKTVTKKRSQPHVRSHLMLCLAAFSLLVIGQQAQYGIENVYLLNTPLCMDSILVGYWKTFRLIIISISMFVFALYVLPRLGDVYVTTISCLSSISYFLLFPFSTQVWMAFLVLIPNFGSRMNQPVTRTIMSKMVSLDEQGGLISVLYVVEKVSQLAANAVFNNLYAATLTIFRGTTHMCFAAITGVGMILILIYKHIAQRRMTPENVCVTQSRF